MPRYWTDFECKLIDIIKNEYKLKYQPCWRNHSSNFKITWSEIASRFPDVTATQCKHKWHSIRSRFIKARKKTASKDTKSKYLDGRLDFLDEYVSLTKKSASKPRKMYSILGYAESPGSVSNSYNFPVNQLQSDNKQSLIQNKINTISENVEMVLANTSLVTLDNINWLLSKKEDDSCGSICVTQNMIETILKSKNIYFNIVTEEPTSKALEDELENAIADPPKKHVTLDPKTGKSNHYSKINSLTQSELTQSVITPLFSPNDSTFQGTMVISDSESDHFISHEPLLVDHDISTITLEPSTNNDVLGKELISTSGESMKCNDEVLNKKRENDTKCVEVEEKSTLNFVNNQMEIDTKKFFTDLGTYVESRFSAQIQTKLRLQIMSLITEAELNMI